MCRHFGTESRGIIIARMKKLSAAAGLPVPETEIIGHVLSADKSLVRAASAAAAAGRGRLLAVWQWV